MKADRMRMRLSRVRMSGGSLPAGGAEGTLRASATYGPLGGLAPPCHTGPRQACFILRIGPECPGIRVRRPSCRSGATPSLKGMMDMRTLRIVLVLALVSAPAVASTEEVRGVYVGDMDKSADPCSNFYDYANGTWRASNPIPDSMTRWSRRWAAGESAKDQLK